jgi:hypothetical protein
MTIDTQNRPFAAIGTAASMSVAAYAGYRMGQYDSERDYSLALGVLSTFGAGAWAKDAIDEYFSNTRSESRLTRNVLMAGILGVFACQQITKANRA